MDVSATAVCEVCGAEYTPPVVPRVEHPHPWSTYDDTRRSGVVDCVVCIAYYKITLCVLMVGIAVGTNFVVLHYVPYDTSIAFMDVCKRTIIVCGETSEPVAGVCLYGIYVLMTAPYDLFIITQYKWDVWLRYRWGITGLCISVLVLPGLCVLNVLSSIVCGLCMYMMNMVCTNSFLVIHSR
jgi:hypothetical protein